LKAAIYEAFAQPLTIQNVPDPTLTADGVIIRVEATGVCRSDWHGWMGHDPDIQNLPHIPGHEMAGTIQEVGKDVKLWQPGDRVTLPFVLGCGHCPQCLAGQQHVCDDYAQPGFTHWGSFAEYAAIPYAHTNLVRLPDELDFVDAASLGCRFITAFRAVVSQGRTAPGEWVVVHGCGGVGLSAIMIARAMGANVIGVDIKDEALSMAQTIGANHIINGNREDKLIEAIHNITGGGAHVSLDALGSTITCRNSIMSLRKQGRHVQVGLMVANDKNPPLPMGQVISKELEILGSHGMQAHAYGPMLDMIKTGILKPKQLINKTISLEESPGELQGMGKFNTLGVTVINRF
jgi:alcohol dehydrogenase